MKFIRTLHVIYIRNLCVIYVEKAHFHNNKRFLRNLDSGPNLHCKKNIILYSFKLQKPNIFRQILSKSVVEILPKQRTDFKIKITKTCFYIFSAITASCIKIEITVLQNIEDFVLVTRLVD